MVRVSDTSEDAEQVRSAAIRARAPEARLRDAIAISELVHAASMARLRVRYPEHSMIELVMALAADARATTEPMP